MLLEVLGQRSPDLELTSNIISTYQKFPGTALFDPCKYRVFSQKLMKNLKHFWSSGNVFIIEIYLF